ncbi:MAG: glycosyltransferase [Candidatus Muiribacterium halophilum]|uniref:Glycosyltransferase n=1 Tax=Muiribacterium halophilum TaxID=2053465 RepID=A0A2N5ZK71_MUIH1|nr:MAG: glycosyltransferase [Candidatus Muirbacterium halophilum]
MELSIVIPVYKCSSCIEELYNKLKENLKSFESYEIIFVNDDCPENSEEIIKTLCKTEKNLKAIFLSKNFGQHHAITAGLKFSSGKYTVVMDCDLQDSPEEIINLYNEITKGYDLVVAKREIRNDSFLKKITSKFFYLVYSYFTGINFNSKTANFGIYSRKVIDGFLDMPEHGRNFGLFVNWMGFSRKELNVKHNSRFSGKTSYTWRRLLALGGTSIIAHSNKPLILSIKLGFFMAFCSILATFYFIYRYFYFSIPITGWTSLIVSIFFLFGLLFINMGVLGIYIGRIFIEVKNRPLYLIKEKVNLD